MSFNGPAKDDTVPQMLNASTGKRSQSDNKTGSGANKKARVSVTASTRKVTASNIHVYNKKVNMKVQPFDSGVGRHPLFYHLVKSFVLKKKIGDMKAEMMKGVKKMNIHIDDTSKTSALLDKITQVDEKKWKYLADSIAKAAHTSKQEHEMFYSSSLATCLNIFCHEESLPFAFTHQPAASKSKNGNSCADIGVYYFGHVRGTADRDYNAKYLIGLNEVKQGDTVDTELQLGCYLSQAHHMNKSARVFFGFTMNTALINMYGYCINPGINGSNNLEHSLLFTTRLKNSAKLLKAYFLSLAIVSDAKIRCRECADNFCPLVEAQVERRFHKVFRANGKLYKVFDYGPEREVGRKPNKEIAELAYGADKVKLLEDEDDTDNACNVYVLETPWFDGGHNPTCADHVRLLCDQLQKLHENGFVHGDVLRQNIIFGGEEGELKTTKLIDFDYSGKENIKTYPKNWNTGFPERHPDVGDENLLQKIHDVYAAIVILCMYFEFKDDDGKEDDNGNQCQIYRLFFDEKELKVHVPSAEHHPKLKHEFSAKEVSEWISKYGHKLELRNNPLGDDEFVVQTGSPPHRGKKNHPEEDK